MDSLKCDRSRHDNAKNKLEENETPNICSRASTEKEVEEIREDLRSAQAREAYNRRVAIGKAGWVMFGTTYVTTVFAGLAETRDYYKLDPKGYATISPPHWYLIPVIGPLMEWESKTWKFKALSVISTLLQSTGGIMILHGSSAKEPERPMIRLVPITNGAHASVEFRF